MGLLIHLLLAVLLFCLKTLSKWLEIILNLVMTYMVQLLPMIYVVAISLLEYLSFTMIMCSSLMVLTSVFSCTPRPGAYVLAVDSICKPLHGFCEIISF